MLKSRDISSLYTRALGHRRNENYTTSDYLMLYACACDKLQWCIGEKLLEAEPICADSYPLMRQLQDLLREEAPGDLSRNAIAASMAQPPVQNSLPHCILKRFPKEKLRSCSSDLFFVLQMLVCMEIPITNPEELPGPLRAEALAQKIQLHREKYLQGSHADQGFTAEDVKASFRVFARSHKSRDRWLRMILGIQRNQPLDDRLDEMTDTFFENVAECSAGYAPGFVAVAALLYQLAPQNESSPRPHASESCCEVIRKQSGRRREDLL